MASYWDWLPALITAGATIYGVNQKSQATNQATKQLADANNQSTQILQENRTAASPGLLATQDIIGRGSTLTPAQELAVADSRDQALNALKGSSLRGSARATSAIVADTDKRVRDNFMSQNQGQADAAATGLSGQYFGSGTQVSQGLVNGGNIQAANTLGQGALQGQAIGDVGALIADQVKTNLQNERGSSYAKVQ